jgi:DNA modification methylase
VNWREADPGNWGCIVMDLHLDLNYDQCERHQGKLTTKAKLCKQVLEHFIRGDCLEVMKDWPDKCVDLVLTDPPYGIGENNQRNLSREKLANPTDYGEYKWDMNRVSQRHIEKIQQVSKHQVIFGGNYYPLGPTSCYIVWNKDNGQNDFADCELAWTSFPSAVRMVKYRWNGMLQEPGMPKEKRVHPTQKPVGIMLWILRRYSHPTDLILDPFCGSGTTCIAAKMLGRKYIGIDISPEYCQIARERLRTIDTNVPVKEARKGQMNLLELIE